MKNIFRFTSVLLIITLLSALIPTFSLISSAEDPQSPFIELLDCPQVGTMLRANRDYELAFKIGNTGTATAYNPKVTITGFTEWGIYSTSETEDLSIASKNLGGINVLEKNTSVWLRLNIVARSESGKSYDITLKYTYEDEHGTPYSETSVVTLTTNNLKTSSGYQPIEEGEMPPTLYLKSYKLSQDSIKAGDTVELEYTIKNNSLNYSAYDIVLTLSAPANAALPAGTLNTQTIERLGASGVATRSMKFKINENAETMMCPVTIDATFVDGSGNVYNTGFTVSFKIQGKANAGENVAPFVKIKNVTVGKNMIEAGKPFDLLFDLENSGKSDAKNIDVSLSGLSSDSVFSSTITSKFSCDKIASGTAVPCSFALATNKNAQNGIYPLEIVLSYKDSEQNVYSGSETVYLNIGKAAEYPDDICNIVLDDASVVNRSGNEYLVITLKNTGALDAENVKFTANGFSNETIALYGISNIVTLGKIGAGQTQTVEYKVKVSKKYSGSVLLPTGAEYTDAYGREYSENYNVNIPLESDEKSEDEKSKFIPRIILSSYDLDTENVVAGENFRFSFSLKNTSRTIDVSNVKVTVFSNDGVFTPVEGSNTFFTENIAKMSSSDYAIELNPKSTAEAKSYPLTISVEYQDADGNLYDVSENVSMYISQPYRFEITNFNYSHEQYGMYPIYLSLQYYNKGKSALSNLSINVEGDFTIPEGEIYIGNFPASSYDFLDLNVMPKSTGTEEGTLVFTFEDTASKKQRVEFPFTVEVYEEQMPAWDEEDFPPIDDMPQESGLAWYWYAAIGVGIAAVIAAIVIIIVKSKKKKKIESDDDFE